MTVFEYVIATLLLIAGLGITRLLDNAVDLFRLRREIKIHPVPLLWVGIVFFWQMQFVWAVFELEGLVEVWTVGRFALLLAMALLLFVAGALTVPRPTDDQGRDAWRQFLDDDRWALLPLAGFFFLAFFANPVLFGIALWEVDNLFDFVLGAVLLGTLLLPGKSRAAWIWITPIFAVLSLAAAFLLSPVSYRTERPLETHPGYGFRAEPASTRPLPAATPNSGK